ncbi:hypothetical protein G7046_g1542 [Stylonectria norvegica]|nr:hypothetical protein G7046_g1542 [Stylonectria norvegica]
MLRSRDPRMNRRDTGCGATLITKPHDHAKPIRPLYRSTWQPAPPRPNLHGFLPFRCLPKPPRLPTEADLHPEFEPPSRGIDPDLSRVNIAKNPFLRKKLPVRHLQADTPELRRLRKPLFSEDRVPVLPYNSLNHAPAFGWEPLPLRSPRVEHIHGRRPGKRRAEDTELDLVAATNDIPDVSSPVTIAREGSDSGSDIDPSDIENNAGDTHQRTTSDHMFGKFPVPGSITRMISNIYSAISGLGDTISRILHPEPYRVAEVRSHDDDRQVVNKRVKLTIHNDDGDHLEHAPIPGAFPVTPLPESLPSNHLPGAFPLTSPRGSFSVNSVSGAFSLTTPRNSFPINSLPGAFPIVEVSEPTQPPPDGPATASTWSSHPGTTFPQTDFCVTTPETDLSDIQMADVSDIEMPDAPPIQAYAVTETPSPFLKKPLKSILVTKPPRRHPVPFAPRRWRGPSTLKVRFTESTYSPRPRTHAGDELANIWIRNRQPAQEEAEPQQAEHQEDVQRQEDLEREKEEQLQREKEEETQRLKEEEERREEAPAQTDEEKAQDAARREREAVDAANAVDFSVLSLWRQGYTHDPIKAIEDLFAIPSPMPLTLSEDTRAAIVLRKEQEAIKAAEEARQAEEDEKRAEEERAQRERDERLARSEGLRGPSQPFVTPVSDDWKARAENTLRAAATTTLTTTAEGVDLRRHDFAKVVPPTEWLNDEIVNGSLVWLDQAVNSAAGIKDVRRQTRKCLTMSSFFFKRLQDQGVGRTQRTLRRCGVEKNNILDVDTILLPVCERSHWTLVVIRPSKKTVAHMDSMNPRGSAAYTDLALAWMKDVLEDTFVPTEWRVVRHEAPMQTNGYDCGVHTITNAMCVSLGLNPIDSYVPEQMPEQRVRIACMLLNRGFSGDFDLRLY